MAHSLKGIVALYRYKVVFIHNVVTALYIKRYSIAEHIVHKCKVIHVCSKGLRSDSLLLSTTFTMALVNALESIVVSHSQTQPTSGCITCIHSVVDMTS